MQSIFKHSPLLNYEQRVSRLRAFTLGFFLLVFIPMLVVCYLGFTQFEQDQLEKYQKQAERITDIANKHLFKQSVIINSTSPVEFDHHYFLFDPSSKKVSRKKSSLADVQIFNRYQGLLGFFQIDRAGRFNTPIWPGFIKANGETTKEYTKPKGKELLTKKLYEIIIQSPSIKQFINEGFVKEQSKYEVIKEVGDYFIFYRVVKASEELKLQGYVIDRNAYLLHVITDILNNKGPNYLLALEVKAPEAHLAPSYIVSKVQESGNGDVTVRSQMNPKFKQQLIKKGQLNWPYKGYCIEFSTKSFKTSNIVIYTGVAMVLLLLAIALGCYGFYVIGVRQLKLAEQRLTFVSSVSHELKTPLTSIRMYSEMLKSGQVLSEQHRSDYYEFIFSESERLSRLIDNILQLSKLSQPTHNVDPHWVKVSILADVIKSKVSSLLVKNDFTLNIQQPFDEPENALLWVDMDAFAQVIINITDNAVKFYNSDEIANPTRQKIDFNFNYSAQQPDTLMLQIRDYGVGISEAQEDKLFELFYRGGNELTRATQGTGIGLSLVKELVNAQQGEVSVERMSPGLAMNIQFKFKLNDE